MPAAYMLADVVVSASTSPEGFGRVIVEAQAMGRPGDRDRAWRRPRDSDAGRDRLAGAAGRRRRARGSASQRRLSLAPEARRRSRASAPIAHVRAEFRPPRRMTARTLAVYEEMLFPAAARSRAAQGVRRRERGCGGARPRILVIKLGALGDFVQAMGRRRGDPRASSRCRDHAADDGALCRARPARALFRSRSGSTSGPASGSAGVLLRLRRRLASRRLRPRLRPPDLRPIELRISI